MILGLDFEEVSHFHSNGVLHVRAEHKKRLVNLPQERQSGYTSDDVPQTGCDWDVTGERIRVSRSTG